MDGRGWNTGAQPPATNNVPPDSPFEEPEHSPELQADRSPNLYSRDEPFWEQMQATASQNRGNDQDPNYWEHPDVIDRRGTMGRDKLGMRQVKKRLGAGVLCKTLIILAIVTLLAALVYGTAFRIKVINVVGNSSIHEDVVVRLSGLKLGQNALHIDEDAVMRRIDTNRYLRCTLVDVQWDTVTLHVREREPAAYIMHNGMAVTLDNRGFVLEESLNTYTLQPGLVKVAGLDVRRCALGQKLTLGSAAQLETYTQILVELKAMKGLALIGELDMTSMDSIYLATKPVDKKLFYVRLGNEDSIHEKLRAFMITRERLLEMGKYSGTIDVADPGGPSYMPERQ